MSEFGAKLSAYLDGELSPEDSAALDARLEADPALRAELDALKAANAAAEEDFAALLGQPVPLAIARAVEAAPAPQAARAAPGPRPPRWRALAASLALIAFGAAGGYLAARIGQPAPRVDWVADVAQYHAVYARQKVHLVEVPATEAAHIRTWLTDQVGVPFQIPDLTAEGLTFQGARLLVAAGRPVGQLMYTDASGGVVALCFIASDLPPPAAPESRRADGFDMVVWGKDGARFLLIGPEGYRDFPEIAAAARSI
jgi:anti-sigma factor RsiW